MKKVILMFVLSLLFGCSGPTVNYPYQFIDAKNEVVGINENKMEFFYVENEINIDTLKMFCREKKSSMRFGAFHYMVFFDSKENASFPNNPFTAFYGEDENSLRHIKAYYVFNFANGFSKLYIYDTNAWEGKANEYNL